MAGCQMVSMNFQSHGLSMQLYDSFFDQNYHSGFVAKPQVLCRPLDCLPLQMDVYRLEIQLISAQFLQLVTSKCRRQLGKIIVKLDLYDLPHNLSLNKWEVESTTKNDPSFNTMFGQNLVVFDKVGLFWVAF